MASYRSSGCTGLQTWSLKPAFSARWRSSRRAYAETATARTCPPSPPGRRANRAHQRVAILTGHRDVGQDDVGTIFRVNPQRLGRALRFADARADAVGQHHPQQLARIGLVVDDQHVCAVEIERARARTPLDRQPAPADGARPHGRGDRRRMSIPVLRRRCSAVMRPPCSSTRCRPIESPSPRPPCVRVELPSAWRKRSNTWGKKRRGDAVARVGSHRRARRHPSVCMRTSTRPPLDVNFTAFESRFQNTCCRRSWSAQTIHRRRAERRGDAHALSLRQSAQSTRPKASAGAQAT